MKLQGLSIVFGLIVIPIILVLTYFIQLQVDTIALQTAYDTKLLDATHDAMMAFELNTANEDLSSVADSLRTIIDASNNIFMNTLATNHGLSNASESRMEPYVPAVLYTLYDGYYINSPTKVPEIAKKSSGQYVEIEADKEDKEDKGKFSIPGLSYEGNNGNGSEYIYNLDATGDAENIPITMPAEDFGQLLYKLKDDGSGDTKYTTNINHPDIYYETQNILKSYMPYSAKYSMKTTSEDDIDVTINYTLDNYLTIVGSIGDVYYTKSGYLIQPSLVNEVSCSDDLLSYNENEAEEIIKTGLEVKVRLNTTVVKTDGTEEPVTIEIKTDGNPESDETAAVIYYVKAKIFSNWVYNNLGELKENNIVEFYSDEMKGTSEKASEEIIHSFEEHDNIIFDVNEDPEDDASTFANHKYQVMKNSIQFNLNLAMSVYNDGTAKSYQFNMPVISNTEWRKIISNVSIVSFLQGLKCGLKTYNNYAIVSSTNNELTVIPDEIYFTDKDTFETLNNNPDSAEVPIYHRIDCPILGAELASSPQKLTSFKSKEVKYDKIYDKISGKNLYDHKSLACYTCIVDGNYTPDVLDANRKKEYYTAIGKQRYNIYKTNAIKYSEGYEIIYDNVHGINLNIPSTRKMNEIKKIEITFGIIKSDSASINTVKFKIKNGTDLPDTEYVLNTNQTKEQTLTIDVHTDNTSTIQMSNLSIENVNPPELNEGSHKDQIKDAIKSIKIIYE